MKKVHYHPIVRLRGGEHHGILERVVRTKQCVCRPERYHERLCVDTLSTSNPEEVTCFKCKLGWSRLWERRGRWPREWPLARLKSRGWREAVELALKVEVAYRRPPRRMKTTPPAA